MKSCIICGKPAVEKVNHDLCSTHLETFKKTGSPYLSFVKQTHSGLWALIDERLLPGESIITPKGRAYSMSDLDQLTPYTIKQGKYQRGGVYDRILKPYTLEEVLPKVRLDMSKDRGRKDGLVDFDGVLVNMASDRYKCFKVWGTTCTKCGVTGDTFYLERNWSQYNAKLYHFNLYGHRDGEEILITKDHVIPKAKGGLDSLENYQTMCIHCDCSHV